MGKQRINWDKVYELVNKGMTLRQIARELGCARSTLKNGNTSQYYNHGRTYIENRKCPKCEHEWQQQVSYKPFIKRRVFCETCRSNIEAYNILSFEDIKERTCQIISGSDRREGL